MTKLTCDKGHFYDGDVHESCPICQKLSVDIKSGKNNSDKNSSDKKDDNASKKKWLEKLIRPTRKTQELYSDGEKSDEKKDNSENIKKEKEEPHIEAGYSNDIREAEEVRGHTVRLSDMEKQESLAEQVLAARQEDKGEGKTVSFYGTESAPVTGWLVCVKGADAGNSYPLKSGQNFIGRALNMDVALYNENSVSRNKHAVIVFEPKKQIFLIQQGESSGLTYVNEGLLMGMQQLNPYDKLQLGDCELIFVPFCGSNFSWNDYL